MELLTTEETGFKTGKNDKITIKVVLSGIFDEITNKTPFDCAKGDRQTERSPCLSADREVWFY